MSRSTRIYLARHGAVARPWNERIYGCLDVPLSPEGEEQSRQVARLFEGEPLAGVCSSGLARAEHTAALIRASRDLPRRDDGRLKEIDRGEWAGFDQSRVDAIRPGAWEEWWGTGGLAVPPGGETLASVHARVTPALADLAGEFRGERIAVVAHKWVVRMAVCEALDLPLERSVRLDVPTSGVVVLDWPYGENGKGGRPNLVAFGVDRLPKS